MDVVDAILAVWLGAWSVLVLLAVANTAVEARRARIVLERHLRGKSTASE